MASDLNPKGSGDAETASENVASKASIEVAPEKEKKPVPWRSETQVALDACFGLGFVQTTVAFVRSWAHDPDEFQFLRLEAAFIFLTQLALLAWSKKPFNGPLQVFFFVILLPRVAVALVVVAICSPLDPADSLVLQLCESICFDVFLFCFTFAAHRKAAANVESILKRKTGA